MTGFSLWWERFRLFLSVTDHPAFGATPTLSRRAYALLKNDSLNHFYLRFFAQIIGVPITPALWGEEEPPHKVKAYLPDTPTAHGE